MLPNLDRRATTRPRSAKVYATVHAIGADAMLESKAITCPYCWAGFETTVDCSAGSQEYYEDCPICCNAIRFQTRVDEDGNLLDLDARRDDE